MILRNRKERKQYGVKTYCSSYLGKVLGSILSTRARLPVILTSQVVPDLSVAMPQSQRLPFLKMMQHTWATCGLEGIPCICLPFVTVLRDVKD